MDPTALPAASAFRMATIGGATALGMEREIGSLEAGKRADLMVVSTSVPNAAPLFKVYSQLVYASKGGDVRHVMVNGRVVVRDRRLMTLNEAEVLKTARQWQAKIQTWSSTQDH